MPSRRYSCGCRAGSPSGRQDWPGCGTVWNGPAWSVHQTDRPIASPEAVGVLDQLFFDSASGSVTTAAPGLAAAQGRAGRAPGAGALVAVAGLVEHPPEGVGRDPRQAVGGRPQRLPQGAQATRSPCRRPPGSGSARPRARIRSRGRVAVDGRPPAAVAGRQGGQALGVEAGDQVGDGVAGAAAGGAGGLLVVVAAGDGQEDAGPGDLGGRGGLRPAELGQGLPLLGR